jgi:hypothetical protein
MEDIATEAKQHSLQILSLQDTLLFCWPLLVFQTLNITQRKFKIPPLLVVVLT